MIPHLVIPIRVEHTKPLVDFVMTKEFLNLWVMDKLFQQLKEI